jgi:hypothetical protein
MTLRLAKTTFHLRTCGQPEVQQFQKIVLCIPVTVCTLSSLHGCDWRAAKAHESFIREAAVIALSVGLIVIYSIVETALQPGAAAMR